MDYGLELPRVISLNMNMARRIPTLFWYVLSKSPPQYQKKNPFDIFLATMGKVLNKIHHASTPTFGKKSWWKEKGAIVLKKVRAGRCEDDV